jgi:hypothetical protein
MLVACKDSGPPTIGPPAKLLQIGSGPFAAPANTELPNLQIAVRDANDLPVPDQTVTFAVVEGGGTLAASTAVSDATGTVKVPAWRLGKSKVAQKMRASIASITLDLEGNVQTNYDIILRFWGSSPVSQQNQAIFENAAARLRGIVTGDVQNVPTCRVNASGQRECFDLAQCGVIGQPPLDETIDDVVIYASVQPIDGAGGPDGNILARAGPCAGRGATPDTWHTAIGVMDFDSHDFANLATQGTLQDVVTHEMLHVLGFGVYWDSHQTSGRNLLRDLATNDPRYVGEQARLGCVAVGGTSTCASSIPVENTGGAGSELSHWREATFGGELMTSLLQVASNPISSMTIRSLADIGLVVNSADNDAYMIPGGAIRASTNITGTGVRGQWEHVLQPILIIEQDGRVRPLRPRK